MENSQEANAKALADAVIELQVDNTNRSFGFGSLTNDEVIAHYQTIMAHFNTVMSVTGDKLKPKYQDIELLTKAIEEEFMSIDLGSKSPEDSDNNMRIANTFMGNLLSNLCA